jgi:uncharacterized protein YndB with AHSA1/START domain
MLDRDGTIRWRMRLTASRERVYEFLATPHLRARFWALSAPDRADTIEFHFANGATLTSRVLERLPPARFALTYFDGSIVTFELMPDGEGGTELLLTERGVPDATRNENHAGWVAVLLTLKAAVDHGIDLRNHDERRTWDRGYADG